MSGRVLCSTVQEQADCCLIGMDLVEFFISNYKERAEEIKKENIDSVCDFYLEDQIEQIRENINVQIGECHIMLMEEA